MTIAKSKRTKDGDVMRLYRHDGAVVGLDVTKDGVVVFETWTKEGCDYWIERGEMKFYEEEALDNAITIVEMYHRGETDLTAA